jgi:hypothetical protein
MNEKMSERLAHLDIRTPCKYVIGNGTEAKFQDSNVVLLPRLQPWARTPFQGVSFDIASTQG